MRSNKHSTSSTNQSWNYARYCPKETILKITRAIEFIHKGWDNWKKLYYTWPSCKDLLLSRKLKYCKEKRTLKWLSSNLVLRKKLTKTCSDSVRGRGILSLINWKGKAIRVSSCQFTQIFSLSPAINWGQGECPLLSFRKESSECC